MSKNTSKLKFFSIKNNGRLYKAAKDVTQSVVFTENELYQQNYFREMLIIERKRTERSRIPFVLMLLDVHKLLKQNDKSKNIVSSITRILSSCTREIDLKGWFEQNKIIGIIYAYTSIDKKESIIGKLSQQFVAALGAEQSSNIQIACFSFPEDDSLKNKINTDQLIKVDDYYHDTKNNSFTKKLFFASKRVVDIVGSLSVLIALAPIFAAVALCIRMDSAGPIFFRQKRIGKGGKEFTLFKFRSMHTNTDSKIHKEFVKKFIKGNTDDTCGAGNGFNKMKNDPRITKIGRFIRKTSIDEFPQFFNILLGDMSLVGPRPAIPYEVEEYDIWHKRRVLEVRPGLTGLWQVEGRSHTTFDGMVRMDIQYIKKSSIFFDMHLLAKTPWAIISAKGAC
ncbi:MAG: sugar transferase [Chitinivibrionales bacterium]|nr:sugar transferase [Chitinivibrionales bacterium]